MLIHITHINQRKLLLRLSITYIFLIKCVMAQEADTLLQFYTIANSPLQSKHVSCMLAEGDSLWIGTWGAGLYLKEGNAWTQFARHNSPLADNNINCLYLDSHGILWIGTNGHGVYTYYKNTWAHYSLSDHNVVLSITAYNGTIYIGTFLDGLFAFDNGKFVNKWKTNNDQQNHVHKMYVDRRNQLVMSTGGGIRILTNKNKIEALHIPGADTTKGIAYDLVMDSKGYIWAGIFPVGDLARFDGYQWQVYEENFALPGSTITPTKNIDIHKQFFTHGMTIDEDDNIYFSSSTHGQISRFDGNYWRIVYRGEETIPVSSLVLMGDYLYAGTWFHGMVQLHLPNDTMALISKRPNPVFIDRPIKFNQYPITVLDTIASLTIFDAKEEDGDIVSLRLNDKWIIQNHTISAQAITIALNLHKGENILMAYSVNEGRKPPNTCSFILKYADQQKTFRINSGQESSGAIRIIVK